MPDLCIGFSRRKTPSPIWAYGRESKSVLLINNVYIILDQINKWSDSVKRKAGDKKLFIILCSPDCLLNFVVKSWLSQIGSWRAS